MPDSLELAASLVTAQAEVAYWQSLSALHAEQIAALREQLAKAEVVAAGARDIAAQMMGERDEARGKLLACGKLRAEYQQEREATRKELAEAVGLLRHIEAHGHDELWSIHTRMVAWLIEYDRRHQVKEGA